MDTMLTYNTNSKTGPVCGGRASAPRGCQDAGYIRKEIEETPPRIGISPKSI